MRNSSVPAGAGPPGTTKPSPASGAVGAGGGEGLGGRSYAMRSRTIGVAVNAVPAGAMS
ncbi:hypothetical protein OV450_6508 [Actinobacteria bacterium OV450]|nr:hypothetical protein OV450_6508 [Actinobacteria bacterium OV450]